MNDEIFRLVISKSMKKRQQKPNEPLLASSKSETLGVEAQRWIHEIGHRYPVGEPVIRGKSDLPKGRPQASSEPACVPVRGGTEPGVARVQAA